MGNVIWSIISAAIITFFVWLGFRSKFSRNGFKLASSVFVTMTVLMFCLFLFASR